MTAEKEERGVVGLRDQGITKNGQRIQKRIQKKN
jgi:hypothetical protein